MKIGKLDIDRMINEAIYRLHDQIDGVKTASEIEIISTGKSNSTTVLHNGIPIERIAKVSIDAIQPNKPVLAHISIYMTKLKIKTEAKLKHTNESSITNPRHDWKTLNQWRSS